MSFLSSLTFFNVGRGEEVGAANDVQLPIGEVPQQEDLLSDNPSDNPSDHPSDPSTDSDDMAREKSASSIPIDEYKSNTDDFDEWIERFEIAVRLATNPQTANRENALMLQWLRLKLDPAALAIKEQIPADAPYTTAGGVKGVKQHLQELLIDPHETYK